MRRFLSGLLLTALPMGVAPVASAGDASALPRLPSLRQMQVPGASPRAALLYALHCMSCHGGDGLGVPGKIPPLRDSIGRFTRSEEGRVFLVRVPGASNSSLGDGELAEVLNWMLLRFGAGDLPSGFRPYDAAEVAAHRRPALSEVAGHRRELVRRLAADGPAPSVDY